MHSEILPVPYDKKDAAIRHIRGSLTPALVAKNKPAEEVLKILHRAGTWYARPADAESEYRNLVFTAFYAGIDPISRRKEDLEHQIADKLRRKTDRYKPAGPAIKGHYRVLGIFPPNEPLAWYIQTAKQPFTGAIPVKIKDYHHPESPIYHPPVINIDRLMAILGDNVDKQLTTAQSAEEIAEAVAGFYFWGLAIVHPFIGGNHRGFDRFIEYAFAKKGIRITLPSDNTLNIPNNDPFNIAIYKERRRLLVEFGLEQAKPIGEGAKDRPRWLRYQQLLDQTLGQIITTDVAQTTEVAQRLMKWI